MSLPLHSSHLNPPLSPPMLGLHWDPHLHIEKNVQRMVDENRIQMMEARRQIDSLKAIVAGLQARIEENEARTWRMETTLRQNIVEISQSHTSHYSGNGLPLSPPGSSVPMELPSPATTFLSDSPSHEEIELKWPSPPWAGESTITYPFRSRIPKPSARIESVTLTTIEPRSQSLHHILPEDHDPQLLVHSPYGRVDIQCALSVKQEQKLNDRLKYNDKHTMSLTGDTFDAYPIHLGGLYEPLVPGRFPDELDLRQAYVFRLRRWGPHPNNLHLYRLPGRKLLLPSDTSVTVPDQVLNQRRKTWYFTYRIWYRFVSMVGPSRFPGLLDESWEIILGAPPEETRSVFAEVMGAYMGYAGSLNMVLFGECKPVKEHRLQSIIPNLLESFDAAVQSPWPGQASLADLIIDLDEFEARRELETRDAAYLWRGVLWNTLPKHCMKHLRTAAVGGDDHNWPITQSEFSERLQSRTRLWEALGKYRFSGQSYVPNGLESRNFDRNQRLKQLVDETFAFSQILTCWKDGVLHLDPVFPVLLSSSTQDEPLDDAQLEEWTIAAKTVQNFYELKNERVISTVPGMILSSLLRRLTLSQQAYQFTKVHALLVFNPNVIQSGQGPHPTLRLPARPEPMIFQLSLVLVTILPHHSSLCVALPVVHNHDRIDTNC